MNIVRDVLEPALWDSLYIVRGTRAHEGRSSWLEEEIGKDMNSIPSDKDIASWWQIRAVVNGVRFDMAHHAFMGRLPWTKTNAAVRMASETIWNYMVDRKADPPDVVVRSHNHTYIEAAVNGTKVYFTPAWTAMNEYGYRVGYENTLASIGGMVFFCEDGKYRHKLYRYTPEKEKRVWSMKI